MASPTGAVGILTRVSRPACCRRLGLDPATPLAFRDTTVQAVKATLCDAARLLPEQASRVRPCKGGSRGSDSSPARNEGGGDTAEGGVTPAVTGESAAGRSEPVLHEPDIEAGVTPGRSDPTPSGPHPSSPPPAAYTVSCPSVLYVLQLLISCSMVMHRQLGLRPTAAWEGTRRTRAIRLCLSVGPAFLLPCVRLFIGAAPFGTHPISIACACAYIAMQLSVGYNFITGFLSIVQSDLKRRLLWQRALGLLLYTEMQDTRPLQDLARAARDERLVAEWTLFLSGKPPTSPTKRDTGFVTSPSPSSSAATGLTAPSPSSLSLRMRKIAPTHGVVPGSPAVEEGSDAGASRQDPSLSRSLCIMLGAGESHTVHDEVHLRARMRDVRRRSPDPV